MLKLLKKGQENIEKNFMPKKKKMMNQKEKNLI